MTSTSDEVTNKRETGVREQRRKGASERGRDEKETV